MTLPKRRATHHTILQLEEKGLCSTGWRLPTGKKGGRSQLEMTVTAKGKRYVKKNLRLLRELADGVGLN
jgi:DNA-binding PadR family transcriptional regulator